MPAPSLSGALGAILRRELLLAFRRLSDTLTPLVFFAIVCALFPLALGPERGQLTAIGPGIVWVAALLAQLLSLDSVFRDDFADGSLEQYALSGQPLAWIAAAKIVAYWVVSGLTLVLVSPLLAVTYGYPIAAMPTLALSLALGTFVLACLGATGAALTLSARNAGALLSLLVMPLAMPVLIFGARAAQLAAGGASPAAAVKLLAALAILGLVLAPFAVAAALRISLD